MSIVPALRPEVHKHAPTLGHLEPQGMPGAERLLNVSTPFVHNPLCIQAYTESAYVILTLSLKSEPYSAERET